MNLQSGPPPASNAPSKRVTIDFTDGDEWRVVMPGGGVSYIHSMRAVIRRAIDLDRQGYEVILDGNPLIPTTGFFGWANRMLDKLVASAEKARAKRNNKKGDK